MARLKVTPNDIRMLNVKSDFAYRTLSRAVQTSEPELIPTAECLYRHDLGGLLWGLTHRSIENFVLLNKGGDRAKPIEFFIVQYSLMCGSGNEAGRESYEIEIPGRNLDDGMGGLRAALDLEDDNRRGAEGKLFRLIQRDALHLRTEGRYDLVLSALKYVRAGPNFCSGLV